MKLSTFDYFKRISSDECVVLTENEVKALQQLLLTMLDDILAVCNENGIGYSLGGGSVLGSVRHRGFIPWDDDIDINFTRADYTRFVPLFRQRFGDKYWIHTPEDTAGYELLFARVRKKGTSVKTRDDFFNEEAGAFIDLFIVENTFDSVLLRNIHGFLCQATGFLLSCRKFYRDRRFLKRYIGAKAPANAAVSIKTAVGFLISFSSIDRWRKLANACARMCKEDNSNFVTVPAGRKKFYGELCPRDELCRFVKHPFENRTCNIPEKYDCYLRRLYGNYMAVPPASERETHSYFRPFSI